MKYTLFRKDTGKILCYGECEHPTALESDDFGVLIGENYKDGWIENGVFFPLPPKPAHYFEFDYAAKQWVDVRTSDSEAANVRWKRDALLAKSDWTQLPDVPLATKEAWAAYRQALRDITEQPGFPFDVVWPEPPQ